MRSRLSNCETELLQHKNKSLLLLEDVEKERKELLKQEQEQKEQEIKILQVGWVLFMLLCTTWGYDVLHAKRRLILEVHQVPFKTSKCSTFKRKMAAFDPTKT